MSSSATGGGGILRSSSSSSSAQKKRPAANLEVTFGGAVARREAVRRPTRPSPSDQEYNEYHGSGGGSRGSGGGSRGSANDGEYDSDDLYDASMAAGGVLPSALAAGGSHSSSKGGEYDDLPHGRADVDAARRRRRKLADAELAQRAEEIERLEEDDHDHHHHHDEDDGGGGGGRGNRKMGSLGDGDGGGGGGGQRSQKGGEFRGEEELDAGLSLISSAANTTALSDDPADPGAISGAYDAGSNAACPVEPFNLRAEREGGEGYFDGDTYVFRRLEEGGRAIDEEPDAWLDELGGRDASNGAGDGGAGGAGGGMARLLSAKNTKQKQSALDLDDVSHEELCGRIAALLAGDRETVAKGLKRYGDVLGRDRKRRQRLAKRQKRSNKKGGGGDDGDKEEGDDANLDANGDASGVAAAQRALSDLTDLADALLMGGDSEVYSRTRVELVRMSSVAGTGDEDHLAGHKRKRNYFGGDGGDANDDVDGDSSSKMAKTDGGASVQADKPTPVQWEYRGKQDQQVHGPYTTEQMLGWIQAGYFVGEAAVDVRRISSADANGGGGSGDSDGAKKAAETATADDLMADLMDSDDDEGGGEEAKVDTNTANEWERSDKVDFKSYL